MAVTAFTSAWPCLPLGESGRWPNKYQRSLVLLHSQNIPALCLCDTCHCGRRMVAVGSPACRAKNQIFCLFEISGTPSMHRQLLFVRGTSTMGDRATAQQVSAAATSRPLTTATITLAAYCALRTRRVDARVCLCVCMSSYSSSSSSSTYVPI